MLMPFLITYDLPGELLSNAEFYARYPRAAITPPVLDNLGFGYRRRGKRWRRRSQRRRRNAAKKARLAALLTAHHSLRTAHYSIFAAHCSLLTVHFSLLTSHYSLLNYSTTQLLNCLLGELGRACRRGGRS